MCGVNELRAFVLGALAFRGYPGVSGMAWGAEVVECSRALPNAVFQGILLPPDLRPQRSLLYTYC